MKVVVPSPARKTARDRVVRRMLVPLARLVLAPRQARPALDSKRVELLRNAWDVIGQQYGFVRAVVQGQCVDAEGQPIPWYTYPAIEQLEKWDFSDMHVFEYGSGNSTLWWAQRARHVTSVESDGHWYEQIQRRIPPNVTLVLESIDNAKSKEDCDRYAKAIDKFGLFDVIVVDGEAWHYTRLSCTKNAIPHLREGGLIVLDNSDLLPMSCRTLRRSGFHELDFCGLVPTNDCAATTSLFFRDGFAIKPREMLHPGAARGGWCENWESGPWRDATNGIE